MLRNLKKMLALLVALQMLFSCMPVTALAGPNMVETQSGGQLLSGTTYASTTKTIYVGQQIPLEVNFKTNSWTSSNSSAATVKKTGDYSATVEGLAPGETTITATAKRSSYLTQTWTIVVQNRIDPTGVSISGASKMVAYTTTQLTAVYTPEGAKPTTVTWKSDNDEVLKVDSTGLVTAMKPGMQVSL